MKSFTLALGLLLSVALGVSAQDTYRTYGNPNAAYADNKYYQPHPITSKPLVDYSTPRYGTGYGHSYNTRNYEPFPPRYYGPTSNYYGTGFGTGSYSRPSTPSYGSSANAYERGYGYGR